MALVNAKCPNCGAVLNVEKDKDAAVCEYCKSAYIVEKAINNYISYITNNISISGEELLDIASQGSLKENLISARHARKKEVWDEAEKAYRIVEKKDPYCIEAIFYSEFARVRSNLMTTDINNRGCVFESLNHAIEMMLDYCEGSSEELVVLKSITDDTKKMIGSQYVIRKAFKSQDQKLTNNLFLVVARNFAEMLVEFQKQARSKEVRDEYKELIVNFLLFCKQKHIFDGKMKNLMNSFNNGKNIVAKDNIISKMTSVFKYLIIVSFILTILKIHVLGYTCFVIAIILGIVISVMSRINKVK